MVAGETWRGRLMASTVQHRQRFQCWTSLIRLQGCTVYTLVNRFEPKTEVRFQWRFFTFIRSFTEQCSPIIAARWNYEPNLTRARHLLVSNRKQCAQSLANDCRPCKLVNFKSPKCTCRFDWFVRHSLLPFTDIRRTSMTSSFVFELQILPNPLCTHSKECSFCLQILHATWASA